MSTVVLVHGGWSARSTARQLEGIANEIAAWGYDVQNVDYRPIRRISDLPGARDDVHAAISLACSMDQRVGLIGFSLGGNLIASALQLADLAGPPRLVITCSSPFTRAIPIPHVTQAGHDFLEVLDVDAERLAQLPRWLAITAESEFLPVSQARRFTRRLRALGREARLSLVPEGHAQKYWAVAAPRIRRALRKALA